LRRALGEFSDLVMLERAKPPIPGGCGFGLGLIIVDDLSRWHRPPLALRRRRLFERVSVGWSDDKIISCDDFERSFSWRAMHAVSLSHGF
jgi:hypothetical protein